MGLESHTHPDFWVCYRSLPRRIRDLADKQFRIFKENPFHRSLGFAKKGRVWTAEIGDHYRAIAYREGNAILWFWIGTHAAYNRVMRRVS